MPVISLLTDFGLKDPYAGIMKGVILSICPGTPIIDITHLISPQDVHEAAYVLSVAYPYFPQDTIHVAVVDPGVGSGRKIAAVKTEAGVFIAPDNGLLNLVLEEQKVLAAFSLENPDIFIHPVSRTFHGRDIFAPAAARLACGMEMEMFGAPLDTESLVRLDFGSPPEVDEIGVIRGSVITADRFGNLVSNIRQSHIKEAFGEGISFGQQVCIRAGGRIIRGLSDSYNCVPKGELLAIIGSSNRLEISVNAGNAEKQLKLGRKDRVEVYLCREPEK
ncbi:MAG: SAM-dependent chlorinase/fluorinase [Desulfobacteraceae bacterium]|nr:SAM-dependent chlorinase/fluorinase [Desulfobacteraceae bacterium]